MESNRDETAHKHSRDKSSLPHISTTQSEEQDNPFIHKQCTSAMRNEQAIVQISESPRRDSNPYSNFPDEKLKNQSISHFDSTQLESRRSQSHSSSPNRMGATYENIQRNNTPLRTSADRPDGVKQQLQSRDLHIPLSRPNSNRTQRTSMGLESVAPDLHLLSVMVNTISNNHTSNVQGTWVNNSTLVPGGTLISLHPEHVHKTLESNSLRSN